MEFRRLVRDHYNGTSAVAIWGITMGPKYVNGHMIPDHNQVNILGKIESAAVISKNYILINVKTTVQKERKYLGESNEISSITQTYTSVTPIGVRCDGDAAQVVKQFTPGTYINSTDMWTRKRWISTKLTPISLTALLVPVWRSLEISSL